MFTTQAFSNWTFLGVPDLETRYVTVLVVLATTVMICVRSPQLCLIFMNPQPCVVCHSYDLPSLSLYTPMVKLSGSKTST